MFEPAFLADEDWRLEPPEPAALYPERGLFEPAFLADENWRVEPPEPAAFYAMTA